MVTGASSGIGAAIARQLAGWGCDVLLVARRADRLAALAAELHATHGVRADWISLDLAESGSAEKLLAAAYANGADVDILVNSAGFGAYQYFHHTPWDRNAAMIRLNVVALAELTQRFLQVMLRQSRPAYVLNVSSIAAFIPMPFLANYSATKAYVQVFTESLAAELRGTHVSCTSLCAGGTRTEFSEMAGQKPGKMAWLAMMDADRVAAIGLRAMLRRKRQVVPGLRNRVLLFFCTLPPVRWIAGALAVRMLDKPAAPGKTGVSD